MKNKSLNKKNVKHKDPKTHTHMLNKSNQFYISKTSQDSLVSIHQHIKKISSMYANMVTRPKVQEEGDKHSP